MNQINELPTEKNFGKSFDYTRWSGKNSFASLHRVPWNSDYRDIVVFDSANRLNDYLDNTKPILKNFTYSYLKMNQPVRVDVPFNVALEFNYLRVWNPDQPIEGDAPRYLYYFINDVVYNSPQSTMLVLQLDVWQTFGREIRFGRCFIEQGHVGIAQDEKTDPWGDRFLTVPEGLDLGGDYQVVHKGVGVSVASAAKYENYQIMIVSNTDLTIDGGNKDNPELKTATGSDFEGTPNGSDIYIVETLAGFKQIMHNLSEKPWMTQGIVSITIIPSAFLVNISSWPSATIAGVSVKRPNRDSKMQTVKEKSFTTGLRNTVLNLLPDRYRHLRKLLTFPYLAIEVSSYSNEPVILKPELWRDDNGEFGIKVHMAPPSPRTAIYPIKYNSREKSLTDESGEFLNNSVYIANFPQFSVVNNGYISMIASQAHGIAQSYRSADWSQNKAIQGANTSYDQATSGMNLAEEMRNITLDTQAANANLANQTRGMRAGVNMIGSAANGVVRGGAVGAIGGMLTEAAGAAIDINQNTQAANISMKNTSRSADASISNMAFQRDTNLDYAKFAARGDYQNQISAIQARVQDAKLTQPSASGTVGGDAFNLTQYKMGVDVKLKMPPRGAIEAVCEYWLRYGYAINRYMVPPENLMCMTRFTYWKMKETYITDARCPEPIKQAIRGIMESGVTVFKNPDDIGTVDPGENLWITKDYFKAVAW